MFAQRGQKEGTEAAALIKWPGGIKSDSPQSLWILSHKLDKIKEVDTDFCQFSLILFWDKFKNLENVIGVSHPCL